ncbi:DUF512 domain-containing protein [Acetonema longum]|uniref:NifB/MoaA family Fe-S oxidoreductase n=1 Tax=Acetonema longum DSM 6540 TaxID=1009370 RepID=F7NGB9_9FIRM|nr:DUF512 domain-containing protein [Acetonema longum]EGO64912.1 NifB/MoaA family Fe-S oxidoreductase [Acetonema longum DSM 6540]
MLYEKGTIAAVKPNGIADRLGIKPGDRLVTVNGRTVKDLIDLSFALAEERLELVIEKGRGIQKRLRLHKKYDADLGLEFESAVFDQVKRCANRCLFCFVDQMPAGMRDSLYVKDDDYRLSFLYGNFVTLTNLSEADLLRIKQLHLSPLYVSVHCTKGDLRAEMMGNPRAANIMDQIRELIDSGIELHIQVVLCPDFNDGSVLTKTFEDLYRLNRSIRSVAIVPVGLTRHRQSCPPLSSFTPDSAREVIRQVAPWQQKCRQQLGHSFIYLADEFYRMADTPLPVREEYDGFPQLENGVGLIRTFLDEWYQCAAEISLPAYDQPFYLDIVSGMSFAPILQSILNGLGEKNLHIRVIPVLNRYFGSQITVSGLLTGNDIIDAVREMPGPRNGIIFPGTALRKGESVFLDNMKVEQISDALGVVARGAYGGQDLRRVLAGWR